MSEPARKMMARSGEPDAVSALLNPSAIESTPTNTPTTPAMPKTVAMAAPLRSGTLSKLKRVTAKICESQLRKWVMAYITFHSYILRKASATFSRMA